MKNFTQAYFCLLLLLIQALIKSTLGQDEINNSLSNSVNDDNSTMGKVRMVNVNSQESLENVTGEQLMPPMDTKSSDEIVNGINVISARESEKDKRLSRESLNNPDSSKTTNWYEFARNKNQTEKQSIELIDNKFSNEENSLINLEMYTKGMPKVRVIRDTSIETLPSMALIYNCKHDRYCVGNFINTNQILTAASCFVETNYEETLPEHIVIRYGATSSRKSEGHFTSPVRIDIDPNFLYSFNSFSYYRNLAVLTLAHDIETDVATEPAEVEGMETSQLVGKKCLTAGWSQDDTDKTFKNLMSAKVKVMDDDSCLKNLKTAQYAWVICVELQENTFCHIDTGAPLFCEDKLVGVHNGNALKCAKCPGCLLFFTPLKNAEDFINGVEVESSNVTTVPVYNETLPSKSDRLQFYAPVNLILIYYVYYV